MGSWSGIYSKQIETVLCKVAKTAIARKGGVDGGFIFGDIFPN